MTGVLLDTNALLWVLAGQDELGARARALLAASRPAHFSAVSVLEITIKHMLGRIDVPGDVSAGAQRAGLGELPFRADHAAGLLDFPALSRHDPFDRMLLAQAATDQLRLLTSDRFLLGLGFDWVVDARA
ncbi:type II toxin-antitoxin system VapC family toxin [Georgenia satyanarayanai]|uniref:type II toxin-antitoxin system VapC family toxin n=1 Tax=Georgenia satyanarayanai TaxID=860221 RepID=UPI00203D5571|nr:type II toxin-antitoxin system VapC family toxin [Georgenia satyanarayanai]MCM3662196.1 type II toxin-antitoxin system VapC family toxin [Georgenia satyanarayanai]